MNRRPVIGVTGPVRGGLAAWWATALAIRLQGGRPRRITPARRFGIEALDGLVIGGGADIDPERYGMEEEIRAIRREMRRQPKAISLVKWLAYPLVVIFRRLFSTKQFLGKDQARDDLEFGLLRNAVEREIPVLGICRGAQLINVHFGGDLHQDLAEFYVEAPQSRSVFPHKLIKVDQDSCLAQLLGTTSCHVNALHSQAVDELGSNIRVAAREETGVVQAIEHDTLGFLVGVQWHPEYLVLDEHQRALFRHLVKTARDAEAAC